MSMNRLIHPIEGHTPAQTWLKAVNFIAEREGRSVFNLILGVHSPIEVAADDFRLQDLVDDFLTSHGKQPLVTTAGTIFPAGIYLQGGADAVYKEFPDLYRKFKTNWGTYAGRMFCPTIISKGKERVPIQVIIEKLKAQKERGHMRAAYEVKLFEEIETCEISTYQPESDCGMTRGQPCLTHLSFKLQSDGSVSLTAVYRTHYYIEKTLGNLLGLGQLLSFVAEEAGLTPGALICHSTMAELDTANGGENGWNQHDVDVLLAKCKACYAKAESGHSGSGHASNITTADAMNAV